MIMKPNGYVHVLGNKFCDKKKAKKTTKSSRQQTGTYV